MCEHCCGKDEEWLLYSYAGRGRAGQKVNGEVGSPGTGPVGPLGGCSVIAVMAG